MQHFYDGQIRRYLTQIIRMMSGFAYKDGKGNLTTVPVMYGDITRQVGSILRDNSENKIPSAPRMGVYVTGLEMDSARLSDSSYVSKVHIRERALNEEGTAYLNTDGKNYTVERLMPTPYNLTVNVDLWTTNTEQKLQLLEQILMLFNPSLELQTTDNYLDWTSLTVVNLDSITWSSRSIPTGTTDEIDVASMTFSTPIYLTPPAKVKRLGIVTDVITRVFNGTDFVDIDDAANISTSIYIDKNGDLQRNKTQAYWDQTQSNLSTMPTSYGNTGLFVLNNTIKLITKGAVGSKTWPEFLLAFPTKFQDGITQIRLRRADIPYDIVGALAINPLDETEATVVWDEDTIPTDTSIPSELGTRSKIDYIIDPTKTNPLTSPNIHLSGNPRILLLGSIGDPSNANGADAWKNLDNTDFVANENDIVEWDGSKWTIVFDADTDVSIYGTVYTTNLNTGVQYKFDGEQWLLSFEGEYPNGTWRLNF
jgi:hypothetical protein